jgi:ribosomal protein L40E
MVQADEHDFGTGPGQYLVPGEKVLRYSSSVGIKKFFFNAYITDRRIFLVDQNEKKSGVISKEIPRDVVMGSHLESPGSPDPFLVLTIRTSADETRTMKIAFIQEGNDRTAEIEEWISVLHGRPLRPVKSVMRHRETPVTVHKDDLHRTKPHEKLGQRQHAYHEAVIPGTEYQRVDDKASLAEPDNSPVAAPVLHQDEHPVTGQNTEPVPDVGEIAFCHHCGKRAPSSANFCPFCGTKLHRPGHFTGTRS